MPRQYLIIGAGFTGATLARLLAESGNEVTIVDMAEGPGGMARDGISPEGIRVHWHGPHIFHTNSEQVWNILSRFTRWNDYVHRALSRVGEMYLPFPVNLKSLNGIFGTSLDADDMRIYLRAHKICNSDVNNNAESYLLNEVGAEVFSRFYRGYISKFWGHGAEALDARIVRRVRPRLSWDDRYFQDRYQALPSDGYVALFERMLDHRNIRCRFRDRYEPSRTQASPGRRIIYTGSLPEYFSDDLGPLPYRSIRFEYEVFAGKESPLPAASINYPGDEAYTRASDMRRITGQDYSQTIIVREYPTDHGPALYPLANAQSRAVAALYVSRARKVENVWFAGRLGRYRYINMDQAVGAAMALAKRLN